MMTTEASELLKLHNELLAIRNSNGLAYVFQDWFGKPQYKRHEEKYMDIISYALRHQYAALELVVEGRLDLNTVTSYLMCSGFVAKEKNPHLLDFFKAVDSVADKLSAVDRNYLNWLHRVHGY